MTSPAIEAAARLLHAAAYLTDGCGQPILLSQGPEGQVTRPFVMLSLPESAYICLRKAVELVLEIEQ